MGEAVVTGWRRRHGGAMARRRRHGGAVRLHTFIEHSAVCVPFPSLFGEAALLHHHRRPTCPERERRPL